MNGLQMWKVLRWFDRGWWAYLFNDLGDVTSAKIEFEIGSRIYVYRELPWPRLFGFESVFERVVCRAKGHPKGEVFYNPGGYEPDHHCQTCGEEIG